MTPELSDQIIEKIAQRVTALLAASQGVRPRLLTIEQAATYIGRSEKAVRHLVASRTLPRVKTDTRIMLDVRDLDVWIDSNKVA